MNQIELTRLGDVERAPPWPDEAALHAVLRIGPGRLHVFVAHLLPYGSSVRRPSAAPLIVSLLKRMGMYCTCCQRSIKLL